MKQSYLSPKNHFMVKIIVYYYYQYVKKIKIIRKFYSSHTKLNMWYIFPRYASTTDMLNQLYPDTIILCVEYFWQGWPLTCKIKKQKQIIPWHKMDTILTMTFMIAFSEQEFRTFNWNFNKVFLNEQFTKCEYLIHLMAWCRTGAKPSPEPMIT